MANWFDKLKTGAFGAAKAVTCKNCGRDYNPVEHGDCPHCELMKETVIMSANEAANARGGPSLISRYVEDEVSGSEEVVKKGGLLSQYGEPEDEQDTDLPGAGGGLLEQFADGNEFEFDSPSKRGGLIDQFADSDEFEFDQPSQNGGLLNSYLNDEETDGHAEDGSSLQDAQPREPGSRSHSDWAEEPSLSLEFDQGLFSSGELDFPESRDLASVISPSSKVQLEQDDADPANWGTVQFDASELTNAQVIPKPEPQSELENPDQHDLASETYLPPGESPSQFDFGELDADEEPTLAVVPQPEILTPTEHGASQGAGDELDEKTVISTSSKAKGLANKTPAPESVSDDPVVGWLVVVEGPGTGFSRTLGAGINSIGRSPDQPVSLYFGSASDKELSRSDHAHVIYDGINNKFKLQHGRSRNLSYLNDQPVLEVMDLKPYDRIRIGNTTLIFVPFCGDEYSW